MEALKFLLKTITILGMILLTIMAFTRGFPAYLVFMLWLLFVVLAVIWGNLHEDL